MDTRHQKLLLWILPFIQFSHIVDFMMLMPLGPQLMQIFQISPAQFGYLVSAYTFSAGLSGLLGGFFLDRFDRKKALLTVYFGFTVGTFCCAISPNYQILLASRILAGAFGGLLSATILSIIGDAFPYEKRGQAMGIIMAAFSLASIIGVPFGIMIAAHTNWQTPFYLLASISLIALFTAQRVLPELSGHMTQKTLKPIETLKIIFGKSIHYWAFALTLLATMSSFMIIPFISPFLVSNGFMTNTTLPLLYFFGGIFTFFSSQLIGRLSDRFGKHNIFILISMTAILPMLLITHLPTGLPLVFVNASGIFFMVFVSGRMVPMMAMITAVVAPQNRGSFMSFNSAIQQFSSALATLIGGSLLANGLKGELLHYGQVGFIGAVLAFVCIFISLKLKPISTKAVD